MNRLSYLRSIKCVFKLHLALLYCIKRFFRSQKNDEFLKEIISTTQAIITNLKEDIQLFKTEKGNDQRS